MITQIPGKIYIAEQRGVHFEHNAFRSYRTFNFGSFQNEHKQPFGALHTLNDDTLGGNCSVKATAQSEGYLLLLPVAGTIVYKDDNANETIITSGEMQCLHLFRGVAFEITNPFHTSLVSYLQLWVSTSGLYPKSKPHIYEFDMNGNRNQLVPIVPPYKNGRNTKPFKMSIGKFSSGSETTCRMNNEDTHGFYAFVLEGEFEVQGRLLHAKDGLALWNTGSIAMEALSNDAIILTMEVQLSI